MQKAMQFILKQQAQFAAGIQQLKEVQTRSQAQIDGLVAAQTGLDARLGRLAEATLTAFGRLTDAQTRTEERLNTLITVADRYFTEGRSGK